MIKRLVLLSLLIATLSVVATAENKIAGSTLYDRLGGKDSIRAVVDQFVVNVLADPSIQPFFAITANEPGRAEKLKSHLTNQICQVTGGDCKYDGRDMITTHKNMGITDAHFDSLVKALVAALDQFKVPTKEKNELLGILGPLRTNIVEKKSAVSSEKK